MPQYSLVGVLLSHDADFEIVESTETGISAHNGYTWEVLGTSFVRCEDFAFRSRVFNDAVHGWADGLDLQQRQELQPTQDAMNMLLPVINMDPDNLMPYIDFQEYCEEVRDKTYANMKIIRSRKDVEDSQKKLADAKAAAVKKEQDLAQQDADTKTFAALANAENAKNQNPGMQEAAVDSQQSRFSGLTFGR